MTLAPTYYIMPAQVRISRIAPKFASDPCLREDDLIIKAAVME